MSKQPKLTIFILSLTAFLLSSLVSSCAWIVSPLEDPSADQISALQTEQSVLSTQLALYAPIPTIVPTATSGPTSTPAPSPSPTIEIKLSTFLPQPLYYLGPDSAGIDQVFRLAVDGFTRTQLTSAETGIVDFDVSIFGNLAYITHEPEGGYKLFILKPDSPNQPVLVEERKETELILNVRWHPNGDQFVYHRTVESVPVSETKDEPTPESPNLSWELVLFNQLINSEEVLLHGTDDSPISGEISLYTNESLEYDAGNAWQVIFKVVAFTPDGRYILMNDSGGPFWGLYDLRSGKISLVQVIASSADLSSDGRSLCLTSDLSNPAFQPPQALLCGDLGSNSVTVYLNNPPWKPFAVNLWVDENALVFLQLVQTEGIGDVLELYGLNLSGREPLLLHTEPLVFDDPETRGIEVLYAPPENQVTGLAVIAGRAPNMETQGLIILPMDPDKNSIYLSGFGKVHHLRWGP